MGVVSSARKAPSAPTRTGANLARPAQEAYRAAPDAPRKTKRETPASTPWVRAAGEAGSCQKRRGREEGEEGEGEDRDEVTEERAGVGRRGGWDEIERVAGVKCGRGGRKGRANDGSANLAAAMEDLGKPARKSEALAVRQRPDPVDSAIDLVDSILISFSHRITFRRSTLHLKVPILFYKPIGVTLFPIHVFEYSNRNKPTPISLQNRSDESSLTTPSFSFDQVNGGLRLALTFAVTSARTPHGKEGSTLPFAGAVRPPPRFSHLMPTSLEGCPLDTASPGLAVVLGGLLLAEDLRCGAETSANSCR